MTKESSLSPDSVISKVLCIMHITSERPQPHPTTVFALFTNAVDQEPAKQFAVFSRPLESCIDLHLCIVRARIYEVLVHIDRVSRLRTRMGTRIVMPELSVSSSLSQLQLAWDLHKHAGNCDWNVAAPSQLVLYQSICDVSAGPFSRCFVAALWPNGSLMQGVQPVENDPSTWCQ
jgi:hypothetical protein